MTNEMPPTPPPSLPSPPAQPPQQPPVRPQYGQYAPQYAAPVPPPAPGGPAASGPALAGFPWVRERGIIPLRPLTLSDIFDGAVRAIRFNPGAIIGMSFGVLVVAAVLQAAIDIGLGYGTTSLLTEGGSLVRAAVSAVNPGSIASVIATEVLTGAVIAVVADAVLGRRLTASQAWGRVRPRLLPLLGFAFLTGAVALGVAIGGLAVFDSALRSGAPTSTLLGLGGVYVLVLLALAVVGFLLTMTPAVLVLEHQGLVTSMTRSFTLVRRQFWRVLGILVLTHVLVAIVAGVISVPLVAVVTAAAITTGVNPSDTMLNGFNAVVGLLTGMLTIPFVTAIVSLLYVDCRIRNEGLDVALMRQMQADEGGR